MPDASCGHGSSCILSIMKECGQLSMSSSEHSCVVVAYKRSCGDS